MIQVREVIPVKTVKLYLVAALALGLWGCSEPDKRVTASTGDFEVSLEAKKNWVRPGDELPIQVRVKSRTGPVQEDVDEVIEFVVNNGTVSPSSLSVHLAGPDSLFTGWITFTASSRVTPPDQAEIHAIFRDALATLKIRIVVSASDL